MNLKTKIHSLLNLRDRSTSNETTEINNSSKERLNVVAQLVSSDSLKNNTAFESRFEEKLKQNKEDAKIVGSREHINERKQGGCQR